MLAELKRH